MSYYRHILPLKIKMFFMVAHYTDLLQHIISSSSITRNEI